jgi:anthranilate 1,2-dioxygenase small subunit
MAGNATTGLKPLGAELPTSREAMQLAQEARELLEEIAWYLDEDQVERFPGYFTDDCSYQVISRENYREGLPQAAIYCDGQAMVHDRVTALRETQVYVPRRWRHFISGVRVLEMGSESFSTSANFMVTEAMSDAEPTVLMVGEYRSSYVRGEGRLKLRKHLAIYDNYRIARSLIVPV